MLVIRCVTNSPLQDRVNLEQVNMIVDDDDDGRGEVDGIAESNADPGESTVQYALMEDYQD